METIAKKGEWVIITDKGSSFFSSSSYTLNKPYQLREDLNEENGFRTVEDDMGSTTNGWSNAFDLNMKFKKVFEPLKGDIIITDLSKIQELIDSFDEL